MLRRNSIDIDEVLATQDSSAKMSGKLDIVDDYFGDDEEDFTEISMAELPEPEQPLTQPLHESISDLGKSPSNIEATIVYLPPSVPELPVAELVELKEAKDVVIHVAPVSEQKIAEEPPQSSVPIPVVRVTVIDKPSSTAAVMQSLVAVDPPAIESPVLTQRKPPFVAQEESKPAPVAKSKKSSCWDFQCFNINICFQPKKPNDASKEEAVEGRVLHI